MELREVMKKMEISEEYIIETAQKINSMCKLCTCGECPFYIGYGCVLVSTADIRIDEVVKKRIQELLNPNRMDKVADLLGVKLDDWITVVNMVGETRRYHITANGLYNDKGIAVPGCLTDLLIGMAYIEKEENKNE